MEFADVVGRRRMVRNYRVDPIPIETVERILRTARRSPSAGFSQGHSFVVVTDTGTRNEIARLAEEASYVDAGFDPWISKAPVHVVVCISEQAYHSRYQEQDKLDVEGREIEWPIPYWWVDAGATLMLLLLAAVNEGLGAGFLGVHSISGLRELLQIPPEVTPIGVVTLGYGATDRRSRSLSRGWKSLPEVIHWQRW